MTRSPKMPFLQAAHRGTLPAQSFAPKGLRCRKNCTSLFEIQDVLRRVVFHRQLPKKERLPLSSSDITSLRASLRKQWKWIKDAIREQLGKGAVIYNKAGSVPGNHLLDNAVITSPGGSYLLTVASPWPRRQTSVAPALRRLNELARQTLWHIRGQAATDATPTAQADAGLSLHVTLQRTQRRPLRYQLIIKHRAKSLDTLRTWMGQRALILTHKSQQTWRSRPFRLPTKTTIFTLIGSQKGRTLAYRSLALPTANRRCR